MKSSGTLTCPCLWCKFLSDSRNSLSSAWFIYALLSLGVGKNLQNALNCKFPERGILYLPLLSCTACQPFCGDLVAIGVVLMIWGWGWGMLLLLEFFYTQSFWLLNGLIWNLLLYAFMLSWNLIFNGLNSVFLTWRPFVAFTWGKHQTLWGLYSFSL